MATTDQNNSGIGGVILFAIVFALAAILSGAAGCGGSHHSSSSSKSSKYTQKELEDAHKLYELREEMTSSSKNTTKR